ncbi:MAG TPA: hypothetical protein VMZ53_04200 [Kofleriaceae bacterium]|nr:hypothetical protein [Kofleriaceae bacterium]
MISTPLVRLLRSVRDRTEMVDQQLDALMSSASAEGYVRYLCDVYGFTAGIAPTVGASLYASARIHARAATLVFELHAWGASPDDIAEIGRLAQRAFDQTPRTEIEALGALFVVERAWLHAVRVRSRLTAEASRNPDAERKTWLDLGRHVSRVVTNDIEMRTLVAATSEALDSLGDWALVKSHVRSDEVRERYRLSP